MAEQGLDSAEAVRAAGTATARFSPELAAAERELKRFLYERLYHHPRQLEMAGVARRVVTALFAAFRDDPARMGEGWAATLPPNDPNRSRHIADYIAGMTDRFAVAAYRRCVGPLELPVEF